MHINHLLVISIHQNGFKNINRGAHASKKRCSASFHCAIQEAPAPIERMMLSTVMTASNFNRYIFFSFFRTRHHFIFKSCNFISIVKMGCLLLTTQLKQASLCLKMSYRILCTMYTQLLTDERDRHFIISFFVNIGEFRVNKQFIEWNCVWCGQSQMNS